MVLFRNLILLFPVALYPCPQLVAYYDLLSKAKEHFIQQKYNESEYYFSQIETCPNFYNEEKNLYQYALTLIHICSNLEKEIHCETKYKKAKKLLNSSIELLKPVESFRKELSERYYYLGILYLKLNLCQAAKQSFYLSYKYDGNEKAYLNYQNLNHLCKN
jgi:hypothetical protein